MTTARGSLGNDGSITGSSEPSVTPTITNQNEGSNTKKSSFLSRNFGWILVVFIFIVIGIVSLIGRVSTNPVAINPTDKSVTFEIDNTSYTIPADSGIEINLSHGKHTVTRDGEELGTFDFGWTDEDSIINPTLSAFVIENVLYVDTTKNYDDYVDRVTTNTITVDGHTYTGPYEYIEPSLYIKKSWDYGAYENSPEEVDLPKGSHYLVKRELFLDTYFVENFCYDNDPDPACQEYQGNSDSQESLDTQDADMASENNQ